jgi:5-methylcytosine-specific restriction endonuclease McrA
VAASVPTKTGPATCPVCRREKYLIVKRRYQQTAKGIATARAREERSEVREKRRLFSASAQGRRNKAKYEKTEKGKALRRKLSLKYRSKPEAKAASAAKHQQTKDDPIRRMQRRAADSRYKRTDNGKALKHRQRAKRKGAILATEKLLTAAEWKVIVLAAKGRCYYCQEKAKLTLDHVIPLSKGGQHTKTNVVPACAPCNSKKNNRLLLLV